MKVLLGLVLFGVILGCKSENLHRKHFALVFGAVGMLVAYQTLNLLLRTIHVE